MLLPLIASLLVATPEVPEPAPAPVAGDDALVPADVAEVLNPAFPVEPLAPITLPMARLQLAELSPVFTGD